MRTIGSIAVLLLLTACDDEPAEEPVDQNAVLPCTGTSEAALACCDFVAVFEETCVRCEVGTPHTCSAAIHQAIAEAAQGQGCEGADAVRDQTEFEEVCLPELEQITCEDLRAGNTPASCRDQLQYR